MGDFLSEYALVNHVIHARKSKRLRNARGGDCWLSVRPGQIPTYQATAGGQEPFQVVHLRGNYLLRKVCQRRVWTVCRWAERATPSSGSTRTFLSTPGYRRR